MKVALLSDGVYPYVPGGMQKHSYYLAKYLASNSVAVLLYHTGPEEADTMNLEGFTEHELSFITAKYIPFPTGNKLPGHYILESYRYSSSIYKSLIKSEPVDFIYAQGFTGWRTIREKRGGRKLPPIGVNFHGVEMFQKAPNFYLKLQHYLLREPVKYILRKADVVFSLGGKLTAIQRKITNKRIVEVPIGIEQSWLLKTGDQGRKIKRTFVFIGRYERRKGIEELQKVVALLSRNNEFEVIFIGPIPENKKLKKDNVRYLGYIREEAEIKKILDRADVLVCPSYSEGMPTVILEALAVGLAVIATDVGAVSQLVNKETGWLIPAANILALKDAMEEAIRLSPGALNDKKSNGKRLVQECFTWDKVIKRTLSEIQTFTELTNKNDQKAKSA